MKKMLICANTDTVFLPQRHESDVLRIRQPQLTEQRLVAARERQRGGINGKTQLLIQQLCFVGGGGSHEGDYFWQSNCCQLNCIKQCRWQGL